MPTTENRASLEHMYQNLRENALRGNETREQTRLRHLEERLEALKEQLLETQTMLRYVAVGWALSVLAALLFGLKVSQ